MITRSRRRADVRDFHRHHNDPCRVTSYLEHDSFFEDAVGERERAIAFCLLEMPWMPLLLVSGRGLTHLVVVAISFVWTIS